MWFSISYNLCGLSYRLCLILIFSLCTHLSANRGRKSSGTICVCVLVRKQFHIMGNSNGNWFWKIQREEQQQKTANKFAAENLRAHTKLIDSVVFSFCFFFYFQLHLPEFLFFPCYFFFDRINLVLSLSIFSLLLFGYFDKSNWLNLMAQLNPYETSNYVSSTTVIHILCVWCSLKWFSSLWIFICFFFEWRKKKKGFTSDILCSRRTKDKHQIQQYKHEIIVLFK